MPIARSSDPETSHEAAASVTDLTGRQEAVYRTLQLFGPMTDEDVAAKYRTLVRTHPETWPRQSPSGLRTRRAELVDRGLVVDNGERAQMASGRWAIVWDAVAP